MELKIVKIEIDKIKEYENNAKEHPEWQVKQIAESISKFGFNDPIAINKDHVIIEGHGRYQAALILGMNKIPCIILDEMTEAEEKAYIITHNKLTMNTGFDLDKLAYELNSLKFDEEIDLTITGFSKEEIEKLLNKEDESLLNEAKEKNISLNDKEVIVIECEDMKELEETFNKLKQEGYNCRISIL